MRSLFFAAFVGCLLGHVVMLNGLQLWQWLRYTWHHRKCTDGHCVHDAAHEHPVAPPLPSVRLPPDTKARIEHARSLYQSCGCDWCKITDSEAAQLEKILT